MPDKVDVVYDASDLRALYRACRRCKRNAVLFLIGMPAIFTLLAVNDGSRGIDLAYNAIPYITIPLIALATIYLYGPWRAVRSRKKYGWAQPMSVILNDAGIATAHPNQDSLFHWSSIRDVSVHAGRLFLFTTPNCAIILPRRCFKDDSEFANWADMAMNLWSNAKSVTVE